MLGIIHDSKGIQSNMYFEAANFDGKVSSPTHGTLAMEKTAFPAGSAMGTVGQCMRES